MVLVSWWVHDSALWKDVAAAEAVAAAAAADVASISILDYSNSQIGVGV